MYIYNSIERKREREREYNIYIYIFISQNIHTHSTFLAFPHESSPVLSSPNNAFLQFHVGSRRLCSYGEEIYRKPLLLLLDDGVPAKLSHPIQGW